MKLLLTIMLAVITTAVFAQAKDSLNEQRKLDSITNKIVTTIPIKQLQEFFYENMPAKKYNEFIQASNFFITQKYIELVNQNKKQ